MPEPVVLECGHLAFSDEEVGWCTTCHSSQAVTRDATLADVNELVARNKLVSAADVYLKLQHVGPGEAEAKADRKKGKQVKGPAGNSSLFPQ